MTCSETTAHILAREYELDETDLMKISTLLAGAYATATRICAAASRVR